MADPADRDEQDRRGDRDEDVVEAGEQPEMLLVDRRRMLPGRDEIAEAARPASGVSTPPATAASRSLSLYMVISSLRMGGS